MENNFNKFSFITADLHSVVTQSLSFILKDLYKDSIVYQIKNLDDIIKVLNAEPIHLLLLDVTFPDGNSLSIIPALKKIQPDLKILIFSGYDEKIYAIRYINTGANGFLSKTSSEEEIKNAITEVMNSGKYLSKNIQEKIMDSYILKKPTNPLEQLSNRELEVAKLMIDGYGNNEICTVLNLQKTTVSTYKNRIFEKIGVNNLSYLIQIFNLYNNNDKKYRTNSVL